MIVRLLLFEFLIKPQITQITQIILHQVLELDVECKGNFKYLIKINISILEYSNYMFSMCCQDLSYRILDLSIEIFQLLVIEEQ